MFKTSEEIIVIQAEATTPIPTGVVFWSHDKGTAKLIIQLKKDHINQTLPQGTIVPILLEFNSTTASNGRGRHIYHAVIEDVLEGIVSIVLEDNILGYVGRVDGSVYIELPDSRSLDTAGRFTFDIKRSPIDEDVPELEDYYWKGFSEIVEESKRLINQVESDCKIVLDNLNSKVTVLETQTTDIKNKQAEILKSIEEHDVFTKQESSVNVINQIIGKEKVQITFRTDFTDKIAGTDERIHRAWVKEYATVTAPSEWITKIPDNQMGKIESLDNDAYTIAGATNLNICQIGQEYNLVIVLTQLLGEQFFIDRGATSQAQKIEVIKLITKRIESAVWGSGSGVGGYKLTMNRASNISGDFSSWISASSHQDSTNSKVSATLQTAGPFETAFDSNGWFKQVVYANQSDGTTKSQVFVDYACMDITIEISANEHIKSMIAANHVENLATQAEAEAGEDNTKTMTPLRVFQSIAQWTKNKFISLTENETVLGIKNFANGLQVGGNNVLSQNGEIRFVTNSTNNSSLESGSIVFKRYGDDVDIYANFQVRASGDLTRDMNIVAESIVDDIFEPGENFSFFVGSETAQAVVKFVGKGIKAHSTLTKGIWYVGTASYKAKNKL